MTPYNKLMSFTRSNPDLVFNNDGYENLPREIVEANKKAIAKIEIILADIISGFVRFQNFKERADGSMVVRYQVKYDNHSGFVGVRYTPMEYFIPSSLME